MKHTKIFAAYLPQFHTTDYNDEFWGEGFTDWVNVKKARPQYDKQYQPRIPLNKNYYDLTDVATIRWQAKLAKENCVDGFNIYHYWFKDGQQALESPAEILLENKDIDINYFFSWDNCSWVRSWGKDAGNAWTPVSDKGRNGKTLLFELDYGGEEQWEKHFLYLLKFFKDERYYKIDGKPVFAFMTSLNMDVLIKMAEYWRKLAIKNDLPGLYLLSRKDEFRNKRLFDNQFRYQPSSGAWGKRMSIEGRLKKYFNITIKQKGPVKYMYDYDKVWNAIYKDACRNKSNNQIIGCFVGFDDTPRRDDKARIVEGQTPEKFKYWFDKLYKFCCETDREMLLLTAWNEWGEGAYLEPDEVYEDKYLTIIKETVEKLSR